MYYRISGAPFTVKSADEKQELINAINADSNFSKHLVCRGINAEQFTGKLNGIVAGEKDNPNRVYIFTCEGNFPTLKLYQRSSSVVYVIELPVNKNRQTTIEKVEEVEEVEEKKVSKEEPKASKIETPKPVKKKENKTKNDPVFEKKEVIIVEQPSSAEFEESDPFVNPFFSEPVVIDTEEPQPEEIDNVEETQDEIKEKHKKRSRKKKS